jgi:hypothetical protein
MWNSKIEYELCAENNYAATCVEVLDLGTQKMKSGKTWHPVSLGFELAEQDSAGERFLRRRSLPGRLKSGVTCAFIEGMLDRKLTDDEINGSFDGRQLLGVKCLIEIVHSESNGKDGTVYDNIGDKIQPLPDGMECPEPKAPLIYLSLDPKEFDPKVFESLPGWLRTKIGGSDEYWKIFNPSEEPPPAKLMTIQQDLDDDIPL